MKHCRPSPRWLALAALVACAGASAHDTWFQRLPAAAPLQPPQRLEFALGTGNLFPVQEYPLTAASLDHSGCRAAGEEAAVPLTPGRETPTALVVGTAAPAPQQAVTCWAQLVPLEIELPPDKIAIYFKDINATPAVRAAWAEMQARGVVWKERYVKNARIEIAPATPGAAQPAPAAPVGMGLDVLLESGLQRAVVGDTLAFQVLRDGKPLADFPVELRGDRSRLGIWRQTDAQGRVRIAAPLPGRWVLRGTDLRVSPTDPDRWESRFVTLAFDIAAAPAKPPAP